MQASISPKMLQHQELYRSARERTPPWKEKFRNQCMQRVRSSRARLLDKFRKCALSDSPMKPSAMDHHQLALALMEGEWDGGVPLHHHLKHGSDEEQEALLEILEEIQAEMKLYSEQLAEDVARFEEADMAQLVSKCQEPEVICPVCQVRPLLHVSQDELSCFCGLRLRGVSLSAVQSSIESTLLLHGAECQHPLAFASTCVPVAPSATADVVSTCLPNTNILVTCACCEWMSFLL
ncbi:RPA-interacting protein B [Hyalella azteca]|uniref:RPA-interacting protein B n=1 Tax=Hyalella azteca TaxID=294128 RepID=A0A8B7P4B6_HYAAZ|nr:RPA-interacting protein B [Hyalella azteca]